MKAPLETIHYLQRIIDEFPSLKWKKVRRVQTHEYPDHVMILLDNEIAFRFENDLEDEDTNLARERSVLQAIKGRLGAIPVPDYTFVPKSPDFAGYRAIPGTRLSPWRFRRLSKSSRAEAAKRLADFLSELHSIPVAEVRDLGVDEAERKFSGYRSWTEDLFDQHSDELDLDLK